MQNRSHFATYILCILALLASCGEKTAPPYSALKKSEADSTIRSIENIDSLTSLCSTYQNVGNKEGEMMVLKKLGRKLREQNRFAEALEKHKRGWELAKELRDTIEMVQALNNIGTNYRRMSVLNKAATYHYKALHLCDEMHDKTSRDALKNRVGSLNGIGNICMQIGDYTTADSVLRQALEGERMLGSQLGQAINLANLGSVLEALGEKDSAKIYFHRSMEMNVMAKSNLGISLCYLHFGRLYEGDGHLDQAINEYRKAYDMKGKIDPWHWMNACLALARGYDKQGNNQATIAMLDQAEEVAKKCHAYEQLKDIYKLRHNVHIRQYEADMALMTYKQSEAYADSVLNEKKLIDVMAEQVRFEHACRQREVGHMEKNYLGEKRMRNWLLGAVIVICLASTFSICLFISSLRLNKRKQKMLLQLEEMQGHFFTNITHEFRTPLTVIMGLGERFAQHENAPDEIQLAGKNIVRQSHHLLSLVNQILDISKLKVCEIHPQYQHGDIIGFIHTVIEGMRELAIPKHIDLQFEASENKVEMDFVPDYITKIIHNLVSNAIKFTPKDGRVYLTTNIADDKLCLYVADSGVGIPKEEVKHIYDVFFQGKSRKTIGTGIGLALVRQLVESMNGTIHVHTAENEGSVFVVHLPLKQGAGNWQPVEPDILEQNKQIYPAIVQDATSDKDTDEKETQEENSNEPVLLIVEDNSEVSRYIASVLNYHNTYYARNGKEGLEKALNIMPDIIITDLMMPEMDGLEMSQKIRSSEILNHIPIIAITARYSEEDKIIGIKTGINTYLQKPFNKDELNASIHSLLTQRRIIQEKAFNAANMQGISDIDGLSQDEKKFIVKVVNEVYTQMLKENINSNELAQSLCMSPRQLNRKIMTITGESLPKYIMHIRMQHAKKLLDSDANLSIAEVARRCGFNENSNFTRAFKSFYQLTPSQYRRFPKKSETSEPLEA